MPFYISEVDELSEREEDEMTLARGEFDHSRPGDGPIIEEENDVPRGTAGDSPNILDALASESLPSEQLKPPLYQHAPEGSHFDFSFMEAFAAEERAKLGVLSPTDQPAGVDDLRRRLQQQKSKPIVNDNTQEPPTDLEGQRSPEGSSTKFSRMKQRKLSQSDPKPRIKSGKLALFEGGVNAPPASLGYPSVSGPSVTFGDALPTSHRPNTLRQDSAQERPYRFSFYSNSHHSTIHARSICELPAEAQSFEELFKGVALTPSTDAKGSTNEDLSRGSSRPRTPRPGRAEHEDLPTWWLDILRPTDEEMRMLSKVLLVF